MRINRRSALGAMIGGAAAAPEAVKQVAKMASDGTALQSAAHPFPGFIYGDEVSEGLGFSPKNLAILKRIASGNFSDEDYKQADLLLAGYFPSVHVGTDHEGDIAVLKSVSPQARRVLAHRRVLADARREIVKAAVATLMSL